MFVYNALRGFETFWLGVQGALHELTRGKSGTTSLGKQWDGAKASVLLCLEPTFCRTFRRISPACLVGVEMYFRPYESYFSDENISAWCVMICVLSENAHGFYLIDSIEAVSK